MRWKFHKIHYFHNIRKLEIIQNKNKKYQLVSKLREHIDLIVVLAVDKKIGKIVIRSDILILYFHLK